MSMSRQPASILREALPNPAFLAMVLELRGLLAGCGSVLDLGCGELSPARLLRGPRLVGMDGHEPSLSRARARGTHDEYVLGDVRRAGQLFSPGQFDACIALDVIEHLTKEDGWEMLETMERLAARRVVILTPNGFVPQQSHDGDLQEHLSGWEPGELRQRGYRVMGMYGPKGLRGEHAALKYRPKALWGLISVVGHYAATRRRPEKAFSILCFRDPDLSGKGA
jgi:SAM-dependent methyltransferase